MRKFLLHFFLSAGVIAGSASAPDATTQTVRGADLVKVKTIKSSLTTSAKVLAPGVVMTDTQWHLPKPLQAYTLPHACGF